MCSSSGGENCIIQHVVSSHSVGGHPVNQTATILTSWWWTHSARNM